MRPAVIARLALAACLSCTLGSSGASPSWTLVWRDEFNGTTLDATKWVPETGGGGWGDAELEYYTDRSVNAHVDNGYLHIDALSETFGGRNYTSARLKTESLGAWRYGRFEARIRIPRGQGLWPAFWMLGDHCETVGWPACGEIDIMENIGREPARVHGTVHGPGYSGAQGVGSAYDLASGAFADDFHVFAIEWEPAAIRWYVDSALYKTVTPKDLPGPWVYDHPFFIILNVAVGGNWPGSPDATSVFPQTMLVDYVRVYQR
ncbi:MAG TPA: glycoside hydrolase family 16 protein [Gemmatimonadales bacterium]|nr:glycoside hydrolase family 16 protein [Gemmatimonadales bacterium]